MNDQKSRAKILGTMFGAYGQANDAQRLAAYITVLKDIPDNVLGGACKKLMLESKFLPSIAEIVEASRSLLGTADDASRVREWDEAWAEIEKAMQRTPWGQYPVFSRPEIAQAVASFGWHDLQLTLAEDMPTVRAQVRRMYEDVCRRTKERSHNEYVLGKSKTGLLPPSNGANDSSELARRSEIKLVRQSKGMEHIDSIALVSQAVGGMTFAEWRAKRGSGNE
jgi:hypothetical protein